MSILIKGMDKETAVRICAYAGVRMDDSNFVPVPPHGRLIDADTFEEFIRKDWDKNDHWIAEVVYSRPTIIPAEETLKEATNDQNNS